MIEDTSDFDVLDLLTDDDIEAIESSYVTGANDPPAPEVGSDGGEWLLAGGGRLNGTVTSVKGKTVHARHTGACGRCGGRGGSSHWPGYTCYGCAGRGTNTRQVRLYTPRSVENARLKKQAERDAKRAEAVARYEERAMWASASARDFAVGNREMLDRWDRWNVAGQHAIAADIIAKLPRQGYLSERQVALVEKLVDELVERDLNRRRSKPVGEVGQTVEITATCQRVTSYAKRPFHARDWGTVTYDDVYLSRCRTTEGDIVVLQGTNRKLAEAGDVIRFRGRVKGQQAYDGVMETRFSHVKVLDHHEAMELRAIRDESRRDHPSDEEEVSVAVAP